MFGEKALELVRELKRTQDGNLPPYNEDGIRQVIEEMRSLFEQNQLEVRATTDGERGLFSGIYVHFLAHELAYNIFVSADRILRSPAQIQNCTHLVSPVQAYSCDTLAWSATSGAY